MKTMHNRINNSGKHFIIPRSLLMVLALIAGLAACLPVSLPAQEPAPSAVTSETAQTDALPVEEQIADPINACLVTNQQGIGDRSFNDMIWKGLQDAAQDFEIEATYIESKSTDDYVPNLQACVDADAELVICVGFMMADACAATIEAHPDRYFIGVDIEGLSYPNFVGVDAYMDQSAFQAGYLAAGMTQTGKVATYTGYFGPVVQIFMDGFFMGVQAYNSVHAAQVEVLGYNPANMDQSAAIGSWTDVDASRQITESFMDNGADIILPVAGNVGPGAAAVMKERAYGFVFGVDQDWTETNPQYDAQILASLIKRMDICVYDVAAGLAVGQFQPGSCLLTLENGGTEMVINQNIPIPAELKTELQTLAARIIAGEVTTLSPEFLAQYSR